MPMSAVESPIRREVASSAETVAEKPLANLAV
jgi:hypothetical protein